MAKKRKSSRKRAASLRNLKKARAALKRKHRALKIVCSTRKRKSHKGRRRH